MLIFKKYSPPKIKYLLGIMLPIIAAQASLVGMNFFDTVMSGNYSSADLAGVAVGSNIWMIVLTTISGILMASMTIIANLLSLMFCIFYVSNIFNISKGLYMEGLPTKHMMQ